MPHLELIFLACSGNAREVTYHIFWYKQLRYCHQNKYDQHKCLTIHFLSFF